MPIHERNGRDSTASSRGKRNLRINARSLSHKRHQEWAKKTTQSTNANSRRLAVGHTLIPSVNENGSPPVPSNMALPSKPTAMKPVSSESWGSPPPDS